MILRQLRISRPPRRYSPIATHENNSLVSAALMVLCGRVLIPEQSPKQRVISIKLVVTHSTLSSRAGLLQTLAIWWDSGY